VKKHLDPLNHAGWKSLFLDKAENLGGNNFWMFSKSALNKLQNLFSKIWQGIITVCAKGFSPKKSLEHDKMTEYEAFVYLLD
jgi:hypothetical protein